MYFDTNGDCESEGLMIVGIDTRAELAFLRVFMFKCHSIASSGLSNPSGRAFKRLFMWGSASRAEPEK